MERFLLLGVNLPSLDAGCMRTCMNTGISLINITLTMLGKLFSK